MYAYFLVALGGAVGSLGRFLVSNFCNARFGDSFPWGTILINVSGSLLIGGLAAGNAPGGRLANTEGMREFLMIGICGGYTTFSAFSLQTLNLVRAGELGSAAANVILSMVLCLGAVGLGYWLGALLNSSPRV